MTGWQGGNKNPQDGLQVALVVSNITQITGAT